MATLDAKLQDVAKLAQNVSNAPSEGKGWIWQLIAGSVLAITIWWLRYQLERKEKELAAAKTALDVQRIDAEVSLNRARVATASSAADEIVRAAQVKLINVTNSQENIRAEIAAHDERKKALEQVKNFENLNKIAGVK